MPCVVTMPTKERQPLSEGSVLYNPTTAQPIPTSPAALDATLRHVMQGLQLSRASTLALMRMQLAVRSGERLQAMEAMDRLDTLDTELEKLIALLPAPDSNDPGWLAVNKHIDDQKLALAFEKLALASGIVGPGMVSIEDALPAQAEMPDQPADPATWEPTEPVPEMPELAALRPTLEAAEDDFAPHRSGGISPTVIGLILTLLIAAGAAAGVWFYL